VEEGLDEARGSMQCVSRFFFFFVFFFFILTNVLQVIYVVNYGLHDRGRDGRVQKQKRAQTTPDAPFGPLVRFFLSFFHVFLIVTTLSRC
jgi:hypothetical protein